jgi:predicted amidohydrolase YtcJ
MTAPADLILTDAAVHTLAGDSGTQDPDAEAIAIRDGTIAQVGRAYDIDFLEGVGTEVIPLEGRPVFPGFIDAHTHLDFLGQRLQEAELGGANSAQECLDRLRDHRDARPDWILAFGYDESEWDEDAAYLTREQLDSVSEDRPVAAFREDMHVASVNSVALEEYRDEMPSENVRTEDGNPTGVLVEDAVGVVTEAVRPEGERLRECLLAAQAYAHSHGVTAVHDMVTPEVARAYRDLDLAGDLTLTLRLNYWADHLEAVLGAGLATNHGSANVQMGAIKTFADGSIGGRTARLSEPYEDANEEELGEWVTPPEELPDLVEKVDKAGLQMMTHAIGDEAIEAVINTYEGKNSSRHRIEHAEVLRDDLIDRLASTDVVVSAQPNFLKWARADGLYATRLGEDRRRESNRFGRLQEQGAQLAFGSDGMPMDPLFGLDQVVDAPTEGQQLSIHDALRAYTHGGAFAGFDENRLGTIEPGKHADLVVLDASPWNGESLTERSVELTVAGGSVVYDDRA